MRRALRLTVRILLGFAAFLVVFILFAAAFLGVAEALADNSARRTPSYEKADISAVVSKESWTDEDYDFLYHQTGLGRPALDALKGTPDALFEFQEALFYEGEIAHEMAAGTTPHDYLKDFIAPLAPLEDGDVLVSSSCHTFGWRNGHAALVVDGAEKTILESVAPGYPSSLGSAEWFQEASNFLLLRLKNRSAEERAKIAETATERLLFVDYSILVGFFSQPKNQGDVPAATNCSHLVWQAFKYYGMDIDPDGGPVCTSRDIANSPYFEVVQVYGFDPDKLW